MGGMTNPYSSARPYQMWRRSVSRVEPHRLDPVVNPKFLISRDTRVGTAGSCFAQHIARKIDAIGFNYFVPENGATLVPDLRTDRNFGVFSARYGNVYTVEQLRQLFEEVFDGRSRTEVSWQRPDGRYVDPYRPQIEPDGFADPESVAAERKVHLKCVERVFRESELFIFTLGLTEAWRSTIDGSVFPLAPGVVAGEFDSQKHAFHNFTVTEVMDSLFWSLKRLKEVNPAVRVLLTVSPVPLVATFEDRHVLVSTTYSKSVLRVAAQAAADEFAFVDYFPSYEIITGSATGGLYYENDQREVNRLGVSHAMRCFVNNYVDGMARTENMVDREEHIAGVARVREIICDEEAIAATSDLPVDA